MDEDHGREQYFFDENTKAHLADFVQSFASPCCLCAPTVGQELELRNVDVSVLDVDKRFDNLTGFHYFDLGHPTWLGKQFGIILCDPPFFNAVPIAELLAAIRMLAGYRFDQKLLISWPIRRSGLITGAFSQFGLEATGYRPGYMALQNTGKNAIEFYGNLDVQERHQLNSLHI